MLTQLYLRSPVTVTGRNFFGFESSLTFSTTTDLGWYWRPYEEEPVLPINSKLLEYSFRRLRLRHGHHALETIEHILPLRWTGLTGVVVSGDRFPPFYGRTKELWDALRPHCVASREPTEWCTIEDTKRHRYDTAGKAQFERVTEVHPWRYGESTRLLDIEAYVDYKGVGKHAEICMFPDDVLLEEIFGTHSQGYPPWWYLLARFTHLRDRVTWPQKCGEETARLFALHRTLDILGAFAAVDHKRLPVGKIRSHCGGHAGDYHLIKQSSFLDIEQHFAATGERQGRTV